MPALEQQLRELDASLEDITLSDTEVSVAFFHNASDAEKERVTSFLRDVGYRHLRSSATHRWDDKISGVRIVYERDD